MFTGNILRKIQFRFQRRSAEQFQLFLEKDSQRLDDLSHLRACVEWIKEAQDATPDGGVSRGFSLVTTQKFSKGWQPSYPETTGYIVPTLLTANRILNDDSLESRVKKMLEWEIDILTPEGGVPGGHYRPDAPAAIFDTGQVIRGFFAYYKHSADTRYLGYANTCADFMLNSEYEQRGCWTSFNASCVNNDSTTFNIYAVSPIAQLGQDTQNQAYLDLADRVARFTLSQMNEVGWIKGADFSLSNDALLHTIAYTIDGLYDIGVVLGNDTYKNAALRALHAVLDHVKPDGFVSGRFDTTWKPVANWACLTGSCQIGETAMKQYGATQDESYKEKARLLKEYVKGCQNMSRPEYGIGAVWGSWPLRGGYQTYQSINWAVKYFADLLLTFNR